MLSKTIKTLCTALSAAVMLIPSAVTAQSSAPPIFSPAEINNMKKEASRAGLSLRGTVGARDAQGNIIYNEDGSVKMEKGSSSTTFNDLEYFKDLTGLTGVEQVASPGRGSSGIASFEVEQHRDFSCRLSPRNVLINLNGYAIQVLNCGGKRTEPVPSVDVSICDAQGTLSQCAEDSDFSMNRTLINGQFITVKGKSVGLGCNDQRECRITVKGSQTVGGSDASIGSDSTQLSAKSGIAKSLRKPITDGSYASSVKDVGGSFMACAERNRKSHGLNGTVSGCSDEAEESITVIQQATQSDAKCTEARTCLRWGTTKQSFTRTCTRTIPLTERIAHFRYHTHTCTKTVHHPEKGARYTTNSCDTNPDPRADKSLVAEDKSYCSAYSEAEYDEDGKQTKAPSCIATSTPQYYASTIPDELGQSDSPSPVAGACDVGWNAESVYTRYENGSWYGRIRPPHECVVQYYDDGTGKPVDTYEQLTYREKAGCGIYTRPDRGRTCYGQPHEADNTDSCADMDLNSCSLVSSKAAETSGETSGLVIAREDTFSCQRSQNICEEWDRGQDNTCLNLNDITHGFDKFTNAYNDSSSMNEALVAAEIVNATAEGFDADANPFVPLLFSGRDLRCKRPTGLLGNVVTKNCCRTSLERPKKGVLIQSGCKMPEVELAAAKRSNYTKYIGSYCSKKLKFPKKCLQKTETYCVFNGILPRILHEQGRGQLAAIVSSGYGSDVQRGTINYSYLDSSEEGSWSPQTTVNGVKVAAWRWPSYCKSTEAYANKLASDPFASECPTFVNTVMASCDSGDCGALENPPEYGAGGWNLVDVDPVKEVSTAISKYAVVAGSCSEGSGSCRYEISSWPAGKGGKAIITRDISWPLYSEQEQNPDMSSGGVSQLTNMSDLIFRTWSSPGMSNGKDMPTTVRIDYSNDGGQKWKTIQVPTADSGREVEFPGTDIKMHGRCEAMTNFCAFRVTGTLTISAKPWGSAKHPDCSGFTGGQLSALDFGKMDLSEWLAEVMETVEGSIPQDMTDAASAQFQNFNTMFQDGQGDIVMAAPTASNFARAVPSQGFGPFNVKLITSSYWPELTGDKEKDKDAVYRVDVDWGDCTPVETLQKLDPNNPASAFQGHHRFEAPDKLKCGAKEGNVTHEIKLTVYTSLTGSHSRTVSVENAWSVFPGGKGKNNDNVEVTVTAPVNKDVPVHPSTQLGNN